MVTNILVSLKTFKAGTILLFLAIVLAGHFLAYKIVHIPAQLEVVMLFTAFTFYPIVRIPHLGVLLLFTIMPFIPFLRKLYYLQYARPAADPLIIIGDLLIFLMMAGLFFEFRDKLNEPRSKIMYLIIIYIIYALIRTFFFNISPFSSAILRFRMYGPPVFLFFVGSVFALNKKLINHVLLSTTCIGIIAALYGFKQLAFGYSQAERIWFSSISFTTLFIKGLARPFSLFQSPAAFADYMQLSTIACIILINNSQRIFFKLTLLLLIPIYFYATLITSVRSNWIGLIVSLFLYLFFSILKNKRIRMIFFVLTIAVFTGSQFIDFNNNPLLPLNSIVKKPLNDTYLEMLVTDRADAITNPFKEHSLLSRISLWRMIFDLSFDPIMGILGRGIGTFNADSLYFTYLAELGYPGLIFITGLTLIFILRGFSLAERTSGTLSTLAQGITIMNITFAIINITGTHIHSFPGDAFFWFFNGILIRLEYLTRKSSLRNLYEVVDNN